MGPNGHEPEGFAATASEVLARNALASEIPVPYFSDTPLVEGCRCNWAWRYVASRGYIDAMTDFTRDAARTLGLATIAGAGAGIAAIVLMGFAQGPVWSGSVGALTLLGIRWGAPLGFALGLVAVVTGLAATRMGRPHKEFALVAMLALGHALAFIAALSVPAVGVVMLGFSLIVVFSVRVGLNGD